MNQESIGASPKRSGSRKSKAAPAEGTGTPASTSPNLTREEIEAFLRRLGDSKFPHALVIDTGSSGLALSSAYSPDVYIYVEIQRLDAVAEWKRKLGSRLGPITRQEAK